ncbi:hypothetical protein KP509_31G047900 [Ceratopteris richardii]|uniref:Uncharacterized protein n=1 Tax=Ceratopteris richardii TaxID=49495 RepID=A0A8T2QZ68_CERRI|nr:hypothetical protein KP509_31G047900 [Ceratopteris richardii]
MGSVRRPPRHLCAYAIQQNCPSTASLLLDGHRVRPQKNNRRIHRKRKTERDGDIERQGFAPHRTFSVQRIYHLAREHAMTRARTCKLFISTDRRTHSLALGYRAKRTRALNMDRWSIVRMATLKIPDSRVQCPHGESATSRVSSHASETSVAMKFSLAYSSVSRYIICSSFSVPCFQIPMTCLYACPMPIFSCLKLDS